MKNYFSLKIVYKNSKNNPYNQIFVKKNFDHF